MANNRVCIRGGQCFSSQKIPRPQLPIAIGGLGLRSARGHAPGAYCTSFLASQPPVTQMLAVLEDQPPRPLPPAALTLLAAHMSRDDEVGQEEVAGLNQWEVSARVDIANQTVVSNLITAAGVRESSPMENLRLFKTSRSIVLHADKTTYSL